tara:strand:+ start:1713 stop:2681 length:969 start_codon:yes stop_codon:yes gene_type:complete
VSKLYKRPDSKNWWYTVGDSPRIRKSTGTKDRATAEIIRRKWDDQLFEQKHGLRCKPIKLDKLITQYQSVIEKRKSKGWSTRIKVATNNFKNQFQHTIVDEFTIEEIEAYMDQRERLVAPKTIREEIKIVKSFFDYAKARKFIFENPCEDIILPKNIKQKETRAFTKIELMDLLSTDHIKDKTLWTILFYTGLRVGDALELQPSHIKNNIIKITQQKTGNIVLVPLHKMLKTILKGEFRHDNDHFMKYGAIGRSRERLKQIAPDCTLHTFRHTFGTYLEEYCNASRYDVKTLMGHKSGDVTENYVHKNTSRLTSLISKLSYK